MKRTDDSDLARFHGEELSWLRCTRYCPPKLPRKSCAGKSLKRKPGSHPRIPFTKHQLEILEDKYKSNAYLTRKDVVHLSDVLHLPQSRVSEHSYLYVQLSTSQRFEFYYLRFFILIKRLNSIAEKYRIQFV